MTSTYARVIGSLVAAAALLSVSWFGLSGLGAQTAVWTPTVVGIPSPAAANTGEPQLTISNRGVLLSWVEHAGTNSTLRFAERTPTGWTPTRTVASGDDWSINGIDVPSILRLSNGTLVAQWLRTSGAGMHANEVRLSYSKDEGRTWSRALTPYQDGAPSQRLFPTLFEMPNSGLGLIWLNGGGCRQPQAIAREAVRIIHAEPTIGGSQGPDIRATNHTKLALA